MGPTETNSVAKNFTFPPTVARREALGSARKRRRGQLASPSADPLLRAAPIAGRPPHPVGFYAGKGASDSLDGFIPGSLSVINH